MYGPKRNDILCKIEDIVRMEFIKNFSFYKCEIYYGTNKKKICEKYFETKKYL